MSRIPNTQCSICKKALYRRPCQLKGKTYKPVCSRDCGKQAGIYKRGAKKKYLRDYNAFITCWLQGSIDGKRGNGVSRHIRKYLFDKYSSSCATCGWSQTNPHTHLVPLDIHHIDGDSSNNTEKNLILLCPCCHSLTKSYKGANKNSSRIR